jgi:LacI family transcriptional regulator
MGLTQQDIADALHISLITVHRALNSSGYVSRELKEKIFAYAKEMNYVPHKASQILKRNKVRKIAVFTSTLPRYFWTDISLGIDIAAKQIQHLDYQVHHYMIPEGDTGVYLEKLNEAWKEGLDAVALVYQWAYNMDSIIGFIEGKGLPYITLNVDAPNGKRFCFIGPDYHAGGRLAAEYIGKALFFKKDPRVLVISTHSRFDAEIPTLNINKLRLDGFLGILDSRFSWIAKDVRYITTRMQSDKIESMLGDILRSEDGSFDAIYLIAAYNTQFIRALAKAGIDKTTVVFHDLDASTYGYLGENCLSAVIDQNPVLQGYYAVKILSSMLESGRAPESQWLNIVHSLILNENKDIYQNHYLMARMIEEDYEVGFNSMN